MCMHAVGTVKFWTSIFPSGPLRHDHPRTHAASVLQTGTDKYLVSGMDEHGAQNWLSRITGIS